MGRHTKAESAVGTRPLRPIHRVSRGLTKPEPKKPWAGLSLRNGALVFHTEVFHAEPIDAWERLWEALRKINETWRNYDL